MKNSINIIVLMIVSSWCFSQVPADSLIGTYVGFYYFKYDSDPNWTIKPDTTFVTFIDSANCTDQLYGDIGIFNVDGFETTYNYCQGNSSNMFTRFFGGDSLYVKWDHISQPPPNYALYSNRFIGKRISGLLPEGLRDGDFYVKIEIFPNPCFGMLIIEGEGINGKVQIAIADILGRAIKNDEIQMNKKTQYDVSNLLNGVYFIIIKTSLGVFNKKILIDK